MNSLSVAEINERGSKFWARECKLTEQRASNKTVCRLALREMNSDISKGKFKEVSFEVCLANAEEITKIVYEEAARKGGETPRKDALQDLIENIVVKNPQITERQLLKKLAGSEAAGVVTSIDKASDCLAGEGRLIHYFNDAGHPKTASVRGLKDRLSKFKAKIKRCRWAQPPLSRLQDSDHRANSSTRRYAGDQLQSHQRDPLSVSSRGRYAESRQHAAGARRARRLHRWRKLARDR